MKSEKSVSGRVTAIVASYNHAEFLVERMESLIYQSYDNFEILIIDDNSPDNSPEVLKEYENNNRVRLFLEQENRGWVGTSNIGAQRATGEYIIFTNCDDACDDNLIAELVKAIESDSEVVMAWSASLMIDEKSKVIGSDREARDPKFLETYGDGGVILKIKMENLLFHSCIIPNLSALLIKKEAFLKVEGFDPQYSVISDWDLFFKLSEVGDTVYVPQKLNHFRQHGATIREKSKSIKLMNEYITMLLRYFKRCDLKGKDKRIARRNIARIIANVILGDKSFIGKVSLYLHALRRLFFKDLTVLMLIDLRVIKHILSRVFE